MRPLFAREQTPGEVVSAIVAAGRLRWEELDEADRTLGVAKLRLAGIYDDRQDGRFMLRTRIPGGRLSADQLDAVAGVVDDFAVADGSDPEAPDRFAEITTRQDLQVHWVRFESLPEIWRRYAAAGLTSRQACGDTLRNVTACAVDGLDADAVLEVRPVVEALGRLAEDEPRLTSFLPRKFKVAVTGCRTDCVVARVNDLAFTPARRGDRIGFHVHAGGGLSDSPRLATDLGMFVEPPGVPLVVRAALELFAERGDPLNKAVNRFRILVHKLGPGTVAEELRRRAPRHLAPAGEDLSAWVAEDHLGIHAAADGSRYAGLCVPLGRLGVGEMRELARIARAYGDGGVRLTQRQNAVLTGVGRVDALLEEPLLQRLPPEPDPFERALVACTSAPFCKFAILNVKDYGARLIEHLRDRVPAGAWDRLQGARVHVSGCKASCAQVQAAHVGLRATMARDDERMQDAFDLAVGGDVAAGELASWARLEVPAGAAFDRVAAELTRLAEAEGVRR